MDFFISSIFASLPLLSFFLSFRSFLHVTPYKKEKRKIFNFLAFSLRFPAPL